MRQDVPLNFKFNEFDYTSEFQSVHANFHYHTSRFDSLTIIVDPNIMLSMMKDIIYFYKRGLVTKDEVLLLQEELYEVIEKMEILTQRGHNEESTECTLYVSYTIVDTNSVIINSEEDGWAFIDPYFFDAMYINNKYVVDQMRDRVLRTKKYSSNITLNNELQQHQFIELLRRQLDSIFEDSILVDI